MTELRRTDPRSAPVPPPTFRVGVSGHRPNRLGKSDPALLGAQIRAVLRAIGEAVRSCAAELAAEEPAVCRVLSSLAEGADRMVAQAGLELGFVLQAPLPFPREDYEADFETAVSLGEFRDLLGRAESVFELAPANPRAKGYRAAGELILRQCDLLLVVWDGAPAAGIGGTPEMVDRAHAQGLPLVRIDAAAPHTISFRGEESPLEAVAGAVKEVLLPRPAADAVRAAYRREVWPGRSAGTAYAFVRLFGDGRWKLQARPAYDRAGLEIESAVLRPYFAWMDALATHYGERSRSAALQLQLLASLSVVSGLLAIPLEEHRYVLRSLTCLEFGSTAVLVVLALVSLRKPWHARWMLYRSMAEQMRSLDLLAPLGETLPGESVAGFYTEESNTAAFASGFVEAVTRQAGLLPGRVDRSFLTQRCGRLAGAVQAQAEFQAAAAKRYEAVEKLLHALGLTLFSGAVLLSLYELMKSFGLVRFTSVWTPTFAALLPALGAALAGIAAQGEYRRLARRAGAMSRTLWGLHATLRCSEEGSSLPALAAASRAVAEVLTSEVRDWQVLISVKKPSLPT